jgi:hypothetical protein
MTPQELAAAERQAQIIGNTAASEMKQIAMSVHADAMSKAYSTLLGLWLQNHNFTVPPANDLRWLARMSHRYSWYVPETMGMCKLTETHLEALGVLHQDNALDFTHLFAVPPKSPVEQP